MNWHHVFHFLHEVVICLCIVYSITLILYGASNCIAWIKCKVFHKHTFKYIEPVDIGLYRHYLMKCKYCNMTITKGCYLFYVE